jgi:hypothetical protein
VPDEPDQHGDHGVCFGADGNVQSNFSSVFVYAIHPVTGRAVRIGTATVQVSDNGVIRQFNYSFTWTIPTGLNPPGTGPASAVWNVFMIGVNSLGDGLRSANVPVTVAID